MLKCVEVDAARQAHDDPSMVHDLLQRIKRKGAEYVTRSVGVVRD